MAPIRGAVIGFGKIFFWEEQKKFKNWQFVPPITQIYELNS